MIEITREVAAKVLEVVDCGLVNGLGKPVPGQMCVEAAVCYAMGLPHSDEPDCVSPALRTLKIKLNDQSWSSNEARAKGLRRLALAQLGSANVLDEREFAKRVAVVAIKKMVPIALRAAASVHPKEQHKLALLAAADECEQKGTEAAANAADAAANAAYAAGHGRRAANAAAYAAANAAYAAANAAYAAANAAYAAANAAAYAAANAAANAAAERDRILSAFAEDVVQVLIEMKAPGCQWLDLTETPVAA